MKHIPKPLLLAIIAASLFIPFLGNVHLFDWDEINFAESAREMIVTGNYATVQIDFQPFWEKPPLFIWLQVVAMKLLGVFSDNPLASVEFAARLPNALAGIVTIVTLYYMGKRLYGNSFGWLWAWVYMGSILPHLYFKTGIIDPIFNYFMLLSIWFSVQKNTDSWLFTTKNNWLAGLFMGLAVLTKGPVGILIPSLCMAIFMFSKPSWQVSLKVITTKLVPIIVISVSIAGLWFGYIIWKNGFTLFQEFISYQIRLFSTPDSGHGQPFYYHFLVVGLGCFPASILAIRGFSKNTLNDPLSFRRLMVALFWVIMILFSIVRTKIVHYSSMAWFPISFLASYHLYHWFVGNWQWSKAYTWALATVGGLLAMVFTLLPLVGMFAFEISPYIKDVFVQGNLQAPVRWQGWEFLLGIFFGLAVMVSLIKISEKPMLAIRLLLISTAIFLWLFMATVVPNIEGYTQRTAIEFYKSFQGQPVYITTAGFKSYAHLFYFQKQPNNNLGSSNLDWLLNGDINRPAYFVVKSPDIPQYRAMTQLKFLKEEAGFGFFKRFPSIQR